MFKSDTGSTYYKEIPLCEILAVDTATKHSDTDHKSHNFEIRTTNVDYFICDDGAEDNSEHVDGAVASAVAVVVSDWIAVIRQALMPPSTSSDCLSKKLESQVEIKHCLQL